MPSTPSSIISSKNARTLLGSAPSNKVVFVVTRKQRFAAGDRHHGRAALVNGFEALFWRELALQNVRGILDLAAPGARQVAAEQRLEHQDKRILLAPGDFLPKHISSHRPHLRNRNTHLRVDLLSMLSGWISIRGL